MAERRALPIIPYIPFPSGTVAVAAGGITAAAIANDAITKDKIAVGAIEADAFAANAITAAAVADGAIDANTFAANAITAAAIAAAALTAAKFGALALVGQLYRSVQHVNITIANAAVTGTASISAVDTTRSLIFFQGNEGADNIAGARGNFMRVEFNGAGGAVTSLLATRTNNNGAAVACCTVWELP